MRETSKFSLFDRAARISFDTFIHQRFKRLFLLSGSLNDFRRRLAIGVSRSSLRVRCQSLLLSLDSGKNALDLKRIDIHISQVDLIFFFNSWQVVQGIESLGVV
jgi:hypothetical protein